MDDESTRRNRATVHIAFGESTAVLAAFGLVSLAARIVSDLRLFQTRLLETLDCETLIGGQELDLELVGEHRERQRSQLAAMKTVPLFQLAVEAGLARNPSSSAEREALLSFGFHFGASYQLLDDYLDGEHRDCVEVSAQLARSRDCLKLFGPARSHFEDLLDTLDAKLPEDSRSYR